LEVIDDDQLRPFDPSNIEHFVELPSHHWEYAEWCVTQAESCRPDLRARFLAEVALSQIVDGDACFNGERSLHEAVFVHFPREKRHAATLPGDA